MPDTLKPQLTVVTHYGEKNNKLTKLLIMLQNKLSEKLGFAFRPYEIEQVHGTIIGLEGIVISDGVLSRWFRENLGEDRFIDPDRLLEFVRSDEISDIEIKIGGWKRDEEYGFESRNQHPFIRSFSFRGDIAVAMGWPYAGDTYTEEMYDLRKSFEKVNILHKWHKDGYRDNDFFFVLGRIAREHISPAILQSVSEEIRQILSIMDARVRIGKDTLSIAAYIDAQLPVTTTEAFALNDSNLTPELLLKIYRQSISYRFR